MFDAENEASVEETPHRQWIKWAATIGGGAARDQLESEPESES